MAPHQSQPVLAFVERNLTTLPRAVSLSMAILHHVYESGQLGEVLARMPAAWPDAERSKRGD